jgi:hypothetical protein
LDQLREKVLEGRLKEEQTLSNVFIVDAPHLPESPEFPTRSHFILLSIVVGLASGIAIAIAKEQLFSDEVSETPDWLKSLDDEPGEEAIEEPIAIIEKVARQRPVNSQSLFDSLVPVARHPEAIENLETENNARITIAKQNPYMDAPTKESSRGLHASLRDALSTYQGTHS